MAKFGINDILNAKTKAAGQQAQANAYLSMLSIVLPMSDCGLSGYPDV